VAMKVRFFDSKPLPHAASSVRVNVDLMGDRGPREDFLEYGRENVSFAASTDDFTDVELSAQQGKPPRKHSRTTTRADCRRPLWRSVWSEARELWSPRFRYPAAEMCCDSLADRFRTAVETENGVPLRTAG